MTTIKNVTEEEKKKVQRLTAFLSANKINNYNRGGRKEVGGEKFQKNLQKK